MSSILLESRPFRPFKSSEEYLEAMREDLAEWLNTMYPDLMINANNFMDRLDTGVALCKHANNVRKAAEEYMIRRQARNKLMSRSITQGLAGPILDMGTIHYLPSAKNGTFFARDNVSNFITWCRNGLKVFECLLFETDDLIMRKNEKHVILCLLEVARRGAKFGMLAPMLVQMERQIDREIAADSKAMVEIAGSQGVEMTEIDATLFDTDTEDEDEYEPVLFYGPQPQIITNDLKSLDEMVRDLLEKCTCPSQFPMVRESEGKYRIGDTKILIFVRILRSHVMVRVGGGWDTLSHYLDKHDPCRCKAQHRTMVGAKLIPRTNNQTNGIELHKAHVIYDRSPPPTRKISVGPPVSVSITNSNRNRIPNKTLATINNNQNNTLTASSPGKSRSRSPTPQKKPLNNVNDKKQTGNSSILNDKKMIHDIHRSKQQLSYHCELSPKKLRSLSPSPKRLIEFRKKQTSLDSSLTNHHSSADAASNLMNACAENSMKLESLSDNGSEISDEGYRSLGLIQSNLVSLTQKNVPRQYDKSLDNSNDLGLFERNMPHTAALAHDSDHSPQQNSPVNNSLTLSKYDVNSLANHFEKSGIFINDDSIVVSTITSNSPRPKTCIDCGEKDNAHFNNDRKIILKSKTTKLPNEPRRDRRNSFDNNIISGFGYEKSSVAALARYKPVYTSVRNKVNERRKDNTYIVNTWDGRISTSKKRPAINTDTFFKPLPSQLKNDKRHSTGQSERDSRRMQHLPKSLGNLQMTRQKTIGSFPHHIVEVTKNSKNNSQAHEYDDFTSAWVHNNGTLNAANNFVYNKTHSKRSSAASSVESTHSRDMTTKVSPRKERGISKIPAPIRNNTVLY